MLQLSRKILIYSVLWLSFLTIAYSQDCQISNIIVEAHECDENGQYLIDIAFDSDNVGNDGFTIRGNGENYGNFSYDLAFVTLGPFDGNSDIPNEFVIIDSQHDGCRAEIGFEPLHCNPLQECDIVELSVVSSQDCNKDGTYSITIDFEVENAGNDFFEVYQGEVLLDYFLIADLPIAINQFQGSGDEVDVLRICINDVPDCCESIEFLAPNCNSTNVCQISNIIVEAHECNENGQYLIDIAFDSENMGNEGFTILGNGENYGNFSYDLAFVTLGPFDANSGIPNEFVLIDNQDDSCSTAIEFMPLNCHSEDDCEIFDVTTDALICDNEESFSLTVNFETQNSNNDFFDVFVNDNFLGFYSLEDLPVSFNEIPLNNDNSYSFRICINDDSNCCTSFSFNLPPGFCEDEISSNIDETIPKHSLIIFPNPTGDMLYFKPDFQFDILAIQLLDMQAKTLKTWANDVKELSIKNYASGIYLLKIKTKMGTSYIKVVKL